TAVHSMGYSLTYFHNVDHGRANGLLLPAFMSYINKHKPELISTILSIMGFDTVQQFRDTLNDLLGVRESISREQAEKYAEIASRSKNVSNSIVVPSTDDLIGILYEALVL
ncbi:MAG TPA: iron-containing alcohol dehydrogenase, partial [Clostridiaceae bacterium]|nr:iron-containing alcohol dehydrogenase [Clostridiaceae bacterium]